MNLRAFLPFLLPPGTVDEHVVDNRVFLLGLDQLYRERVKRHESTELLTCARAVAARLNVAPAAVPIEGYYTETKELTEYFRLTGGLQSVPAEKAPHVAGMREFQRLLSVVSSPLYGCPVQDQERRLLPAGRDPLSQALHDTGANPIDQWTVRQSGRALTPGRARGGRFLARRSRIYRAGCSDPRGIARVGGPVCRACCRNQCAAEHPAYSGLRLASG